MRLALFFLLTVLLPGCSQTPTRTPAVTATPQAVPLGNQQQLRDRLYQQYREWRGTPYRDGGLSKQGVDCSGFVQITFARQLGYQLPRSTSQQVLLGRAVSVKQLQVGDLVFFKTGHKVRHVGIYLGDGNFLHASTSRGVIISSLNNAYWRGNYWQARRL